MVSFIGEATKRYCGYIHRPARVLFFLSDLYDLYEFNDIFYTTYTSHTIELAHVISCNQIINQ